MITLGRRLVSKEPEPEPPAPRRFDRAELNGIEHYAEVLAAQLVGEGRVKATPKQLYAAIIEVQMREPDEIAQWRVTHGAGAWEIQTTSARCGSGLLVHHWRGAWEWRTP